AGENSPRDCWLACRGCAGHRAILPPWRRHNCQVCGDDDSRYILQSLKQLAKELLGSLSIATRLHQNIEHSAVLIDGAPQILQLAVDRQVDFIEMPAISRPGCAGS